MLKIVVNFKAWARGALAMRKRKEMSLSLNLDERYWGKGMEMYLGQNPNEWY